MNKIKCYLVLNKWKIGFFTNQEKRNTRSKRNQKENKRNKSGEIKYIKMSLIIKNHKLYKARKKKIKVRKKETNKQINWDKYDRKLCIAVHKFKSQNAYLN